MLKVSKNRLTTLFIFNNKRGSKNTAYTKIINKFNNKLKLNYKYNNESKKYIFNQDNLSLIACKSNQVSFLL